MPTAKPPTPPQIPCDLSEEMRSFVLMKAREVFGSDAVVRNYGANPNVLQIHIEVAAYESLDREDFLGKLMTRTDHIPHVELTIRGERPRGAAKIAYRQGVII
jgi:hypothetical protein